MTGIVDEALDKEGKQQDSLDLNKYTKADKNSKEFKSAYEWLLDTFSNEEVDERFVELDF